MYRIRESLAGALKEKDHPIWDIIKTASGAACAVMVFAGIMAVLTATNLDETEAKLVGGTGGLTGLSYGIWKVINYWKS